MDVFFTTIRRSVPLEQAGMFHRLDWKTKSIRAQRPVYPRAPSVEILNARGGGRGGRGILRMDDRLYVASYHSLEVYDLAGNYLRAISHPLMVGIHELFSARPGHIWFTATTIDAALELELSTNAIVRERWPRELPGIQTALGVKPLSIDKSADNRTCHVDNKIIRDPSHLHLNAVACWRGEMYATFGFRGVIANLDRGKVVVSDPSQQPLHNLLVQPDGTAIVAGSYSGAIRCYDLHSGSLKGVIELRQFRRVRSLLRRYWPAYHLKQLLLQRLLGHGAPPRPLFVRGLDLVDGLLFVGISPAAILCIDLHTEELLDVYQYSSDIRVAVHGLRVVAEKTP